MHWSITDHPGLSLLFTIHMLDVHNTILNILSFLTKHNVVMVAMQLLILYHGGS